MKKSQNGYYGINHVIPATNSFSHIISLRNKYLHLAQGVHPFREEKI